MDDQTPKLIATTLENFFNLIQSQSQLDSTVDEDSMIFYGALERYYDSYEQLEQWSQELEK